MKAKPVKKLDPAAPLGENAARIIKVRVGELTAFAPRALDASEDEAQHDMRIAAKRLRYVLELTGFCFGAPAETARRRAKELQDILGEMHDCDEMLPRVREHVRMLQEEDAAAVRERAGRAPDLDPNLSSQAPNRTAYRGLDLLAVHLQARRKLLFDRFIAFWRRQEETGTWVRLEKAADEHLARAREARRAAKAALKAAKEAERARAASREAAARAEEAQEASQRADARLDGPPAPPGPA